MLRDDEAHVSEAMTLIQAAQRKLQVARTERLPGILDKQPDELPGEKYLAAGSPGAGGLRRMACVERRPCTRCTGQKILASDQDEGEGSLESDGVYHERARTDSGTKGILEEEKSDPDGFQSTKQAPASQDRACHFDCLGRR